ncbi:MAG: 30S ribosomal protein S7 [Candidatus Zixiibacteriota bacterium]|nr:MAG: 30S ribosomal protein S7 [candidate division Zixibacteria bacterium]HHI03711.1 30S ribosomal protein S7 [candidate division Zixibacteria bacterium]
MPRRKKLKKQQWIPDTNYGDRLVTQFISYMIKRGKKSIAEKNLYMALDIVEKKSGQPGIEVFNKALNNVKPTLEVKSRRVGGATYQVPMEVKPDRRVALAIRWLITYSVARSEQTMAQKLAAEFIAAANNEGASIKKKEDTHKMAEANKAFAHFRW